MLPDHSVVARCLVIRQRHAQSYYSVGDELQRFVPVKAGDKRTRDSHRRQEYSDLTP